MKNKNTLIKAGLSGFVVCLSLYLSIIYKSGSAFDIKLIAAYLLIAFVIFAYSWSLGSLKIKYGPEILLVSSIILGIYLYMGMSRGGDGFSELAVGLGWFIFMGATVLTLLIYALIVIVRRRG